MFKQAIRPRGRGLGRYVQLGARLGLLTGVLGLVAGAVLTRLSASRAERTYPPLGETVEVDGLVQHYLERGEGAPVVFVHGAYGGLQDFAATILSEASKRYRCVLWDRPGHGYSERPGGAVDPGIQAQWLLKLVDRLGLERPLLVGFSYGGAVCLSAALDAPDRIRGVVLLNGPSHPWPDPLDLVYRISGWPVVGWLMSEAVVAPLAEWQGGHAIERAFDPLPVAGAFKASPIALSLRPANYRANTQDVRLLKPLLRDQVQRYADLSVPVTALVSTGDLVVSPILHVPRLVEASPLCEQILLEGAGHQVLYTHPERVLAVIERALAR